MDTFKTLILEVSNGVGHLKMNNPSRANAMSKEFWSEMPVMFRQIDQNPSIRVVVITGEGKHFTSGIDLTMFSAMSAQNGDEARAKEALRLNILEMQEAFTCIERCRKPVIAAIHGACIGGGIDLISACDMRYGSMDAYFCIKEIDIGMVADVGTLQRLPKIIPDGIARELSYTGRTFKAAEAEKMGLLNTMFETPEQLLEEVMKIAATIASKSPLSIRGTKEMILYTRDHSVADGLNYIATWNAAMLLSKDLQEAMMSQMQKREPVFAD